MSDNDAVRLLRQFARLTPDGRRAVLAIADALPTAEPPVTPEEIAALQAEVRKLMYPDEREPDV